MNPYKGLFPYTSKDEKVLFGRDEETMDLVEMVKTNQLVILYGESGTGKTSLINARLFPELQRQYYFPIYVRLNFTTETDPLEQLRSIIHKKLSEWDEQVPDFKEGMTILEYASSTKVFNGLVKPILFFDQFEELFTLAPKYVHADRIEALVDQIADLIELRLQNPDLLSAPDAGEARVERAARNALRFTVVFSLRQDYIAQLDDLRFKIPSINANRYRLKKFDEQQAREAIEQSHKGEAKPASVEGPEVPSPVSEGAAGTIIDQLKKLELNKAILGNAPVAPPDNLFSLIGYKLTNFLFRNSRLQPAPSDNSDTNRQHADYWKTIGIDPTVLSLYCYQLFEDSVKAGNKGITKEQAVKSSCEEAIRNYYEHGINRKKKIRYAIEQLLITADGRRILMSLNDFLKQSKLTLEEIEVFKQETGIIRIYGTAEKEIELAHDQIAKQVLIDKKRKEANRISKGAFILLTGVCFLIAIGIVVFIFRVKQKEAVISQKEAVIRALQAQVDVQTLQKERVALHNRVSDDSINLANVQLAIQKTITDAGISPVERIKLANAFKQTETQATKLHPRVYIQIGSSEQAGISKDLQSSLKEAQFVVPGVENIGDNAIMPALAEVRYFRDEDAEGAQQILDIMKKLGIPKVKEKPSKITGLARGTRPGHYEVWFAKE